MKRIWFWVIALVLVLIIALAGYFGYRHYHPSTELRTTLSTRTAKKPVTKAKTAPPPSYHVGDTQTDGSLVITLDSTFSITQAQDAMPIGAPNTILFAVLLTIKNNGQSAVFEDSSDGVPAESSVYIQTGTDTGTGKYVEAYQDTVGASPLDSECHSGIFENDIAYIAPASTVSGCEVFAVPSNVLVDTYFYNNLKWYL